MTERHVRKKNNPGFYRQRVASSSDGVGARVTDATRIPLGLRVRLGLIRPTAPTNCVGHVGGPNTRLAGGLPREERDLPPSCPVAACKDIKTDSRLC